MLNSRIRREQVCARCRNHGIFAALKGHKKQCPHIDCKCLKCEETKIRQKFIAREIAFHRRNSKNTQNVDEIERIEKTANYLCEVRRNQMCARCRNHGLNHIIRGHKNLCPHSNCTCEKCQITKERRKIMAKQIRDYRTSKVMDEGTETLTTSDYETSLPEERDSGYSTSPTSSPEADIEMISFPNPSKHTKKLQEIEENQTVILAKKQDESGTESLYKSLPPEMLNTFFMVESLYEKYCLKDCSKKVQFAYAFVLLAHQNWSLVENALTRGMLYAEEFYKYHQQMASENLAVVGNKLSLLHLLPQHPAVRVRPMNGKF